MAYSIKEVADMMGVNTSTIRYYDKMGLLPNIKRVNGKRVFQEKDFAWLRVLNCLKNTNMPIKKIKEYVDLVSLGDSSLEERFKIVEEQKENILSEIAKLNYYLKEIEYKEWYYKEALKIGSEKELLSKIDSRGSLKIDNIPVNEDK